MTGLRKLAALRFRVGYLVILILVLDGVGFTWSARNANNIRSAENAAIRTDDLKWCKALTILTENPAPYPANPQANPSRVQSYKLYVALTTLKQQQGCDQSGLRSN